MRCRPVLQHCGAQPPGHSHQLQSVVGRKTICHLKYYQVSIQSLTGLCPFSIWSQVFIWSLFSLSFRGSCGQGTLPQLTLVKGRGGVVRLAAQHTTRLPDSCQPHTVCQANTHTHQLNITGCKARSREQTADSREGCKAVCGSVLSW